MRALLNGLQCCSSKLLRSMKWTIGQEVCCLEHRIGVYAKPRDAGRIALLHESVFTATGLTTTPIVGQSLLSFAQGKSAPCAQSTLTRNNRLYETPRRAVAKAQ